MSDADELIKRWNAAWLAWGESDDAALHVIEMHEVGDALARELERCRAERDDYERSDHANALIVSELENANGLLASELERCRERIRALEAALERLGADCLCACEVCMNGQHVLCSRCKGSPGNMLDHPAPPPQARERMMTLETEIYICELWWRFIWLVAVPLMVTP